MDQKDVDARLQLVMRNTQEIITVEELRELLTKKKHPRAYIGLATTGRVHLGYYIPLMKVGDFLNADFEFIILLADIHAHLDDRKSPFELLDLRVEYYKEVITAMLESLHVDTKRLTFVRGSEFQLQKDYTLDMYRLAALNTFERCKRAAAGVVRFGEHPRLSGFMYPLLQVLDEQYLDVDIQYGGIDQRKILAFARENLPLLGYKPRIEVMTPMLPGLTGTKMSASDNKSKIDVIDDADAVKKKIQAAHCPVGVEENGVLAFVKQVIMVNKSDANERFIVERSPKYGGNLSYENYDDLEKDYLAQRLHPMDLKNAVAKEINVLLELVRMHMKGKEGLMGKAFPDMEKQK
ncbi:tyrosine--tRNA ligase [Candidatus Woesearchaeota archaeon]|nr:tyrosine--tRNA ligase [Candidatus Woesearchaeota archaeon]